MTALASPKVRGALLAAHQHQPHVVRCQEEDGQLVVLFTVPDDGRKRAPRTAYIVGEEVIDVRDGFPA